MSSEKTIACIFSGHDTSVSIYHQGQIYLIDLSHILDLKHYFLIGHLRKQTQEHVTETLKKAINIISEKLQIDLWNPEVVWMEKQITGSEDAVPLLQELFPQIKSYYWLDDRQKERHHYLHSLSACLASPYDEMLSFSFDGGGDNEDHFNVFGFSGKKLEYYDHADHCLSNIYDSLGFFFAMPYFWKEGDGGRIPVSKRTDFAGKYMGLSAYGKDKEREGRKERIEIIKKWMFGGENSLKVGLIKDPTKSSRYWKDKILYHDEFFKHLPEYEWMVELLYLKIQKDSEFPHTRLRQQLLTYETPLHMRGDKLSWYHAMPEDLMLGLIYEIQMAFEECLVDLVEKYYDEIKLRGSNLVLSGGSAYNVCANQRILERFPDINLYVSEFPHDVQQSHGLLCHQLLKDHSYEHVKDLVQNTKSTTLLDLEDVGGEEIDIDEMVKMLKDGKIIGFIQGEIELGARALGNRSILCDPSIRDMKDILNAKVKKREWYRPFGPMCRLEDAPIWFESPTFENMQFMSFTPKVKEEYREVFPSITHVDGTARLQTVTKENNPFIYELLTKFETPLLNTSFNVMGKPILNRLTHALKILNETDLDCVVVKKEGKLYVYR